MRPPHRFGRSPRQWTLAAILVVLVTVALAVTAFAAGIGTSGTTPGSSKQAKLQQINAQATADANSWHAPKHPNSTPITSCPVQGLQNNINVDVLPGDPDHITNVATIAPTTGQPYIYQIYAGSTANNAQQGLLIVIRNAADPCASKAPASTFNRFDTPYLRGSVTLTAISGDMVAFTTAAGTSGHFNFITGQFSV
jgi:hypothetical protein